MHALLGRKRESPSCHAQVHPTEMKSKVGTQPVWAFWVFFEVWQLAVWEKEIVIRRVIVAANKLFAAEQYCIGPTTRAAELNKIHDTKPDLAAVSLNSCSATNSRVPMLKEAC